MKLAIACELFPKAKNSLSFSFAFVLFRFGRLCCWYIRALDALSVSLSLCLLAVERVLSSVSPCTKFDIFLLVYALILWNCSRYTAHTHFALLMFGVNIRSQYSVVRAVPVLFAALLSAYRHILCRKLYYGIYRSPTTKNNGIARASV